MGRTPDNSPSFRYQIAQGVTAVTLALGHPPTINTGASGNDQCPTAARFAYQQSETGHRPPMSMEPLFVQFDARTVPADPSTGLIRGPVVKIVNNTGVPVDFNMHNADPVAGMGVGVEGVGGASYPGEESATRTYVNPNRRSGTYYGEELLTLKANDNKFVPVDAVCYEITK